MFWVQGHLGSYVVTGVLGIGASLRIVSLKAARRSGVTIRQDYPDVTVRVGDGHTTRTMGMVILIIHLGSREVSHRAYVLDTETFELAVGTDFVVHHPEVKSLTLTQPYHLVVDHRYGPQEVPLERSIKQPYDVHLIETLGSEEHRMCTVFKHENSQLDPKILQGGLDRLGVQLDDLQVELFACP